MSFSAKESVTLLSDQLTFNEFGQYEISEIFDLDALEAVGGGLNIICVPNSGCTANTACVPTVGVTPSSGEDGD